MRPAALAAFAGAATAILSLILAALAGEPYLSAERVNGWIVVFAAALLVALVAAPFVVERVLRERRKGTVPEGGLSPTGSDPEPEGERWEGAALAWGGISLAILAVAVPLGVAESFSGDSLAGSAALVATIESGIVLGALLAWLVAG